MFPYKYKNFVAHAFAEYYTTVGHRRHLFCHQNLSALPMTRWMFIDEYVRRFRLHIRHMICGDRSGECDTGGLRSNSNTDAVEEAVGIIYLNSPLISEIVLIFFKTVDITWAHYAIWSQSLCVCNTSDGFFLLRASKHVQSSIGDVRWALDAT